MNATKPSFYLHAMLGLMLLAGVSLTATPAQAQVSPDIDDWSFDVTGAIPVFLNASNHENFGADGDDQFSTRVMSGFNPGNITFTVTAPEQNGVTVSGQFQINHHLQGPSVQNAGLFEGRVADIIIAGDFGTFNVGKGFGIFGGSAIADMGSAMGVGRFGGPDAADATLGRIGSGYTYANFNPRVMYTTPDLGGFTFKLGLINPEKPGGATDELETTTPRVESQLNYLIGFDGGTLDLWAGGLYQNVGIVQGDDYDITGWDVGARLNVSGFQLSGSYSETQGIGSDGLIGLGLDVPESGNGLNQAEADGTQWYGEAAYDFGGFVLGFSYGEGSQDATDNPFGGVLDNTNQLFMGFARYMVTDQLTLMAEFQDFQSDAQADYNAFILGAQLTF